MKHKIFPSSPTDLECIARANEVIATKILGWEIYKKDFNPFTTMKDVFLLDPFCKENKITKKITITPSGNFFLTIDAILTPERRRELMLREYLRRYSYRDTTFSYALAYGIFQFYVEMKT